MLTILGLILSLLPVTPETVVTSEESVQIEIYTGLTMPNEVT